MGCDIHICSEMKINDQWENIDIWRFYASDGDEWLHWYPVSQVWEGRMYTLFAKLADVRGWGAPIPPKGLPKDITDPVRQYWEYGKDGTWHTPTWLTLGELESLVLPKEETYPCEQCLECTYRKFYEDYEDDEETEWEKEENARVDYQIQSMIDGLKQKFKEAYPAKWWDEERVEKWFEENKDNLRIVFWFDS